MLDTFSKRQNTFVMLVDKKDLSILTTSISVPVINALTKGFEGTEIVLGKVRGPDAIKALRTYNQQASQALRINADYNDPLMEEELQWQNIGSTPNVFGVRPYDTKPEGFTLRRKIANRRQNALLQIESKLERYATRIINSSIDDVFIPYMSDEINKCKPDEDQYTDALIEWANSSGINVKQAYNECSMITSSANITTMRLHAHWRFFVDQINKLDFQTEGVLQKVLAQAELRLRSGL